MMRTVLIAAFALGLTACNQPAPETPPPEAPAEAPAEAKMPAPATDAWLGEWIGVEGNTLKIEAGDAPGVYNITEGTLDGPLTYTGTAQGDVIGMTRDGKAETIKAGTGDETGLKYLAGKTNCLVIESGRGFCRD